MKSEKEAKGEKKLASNTIPNTPALSLFIIIIIIIFRIGAGKTTLATALGERLGLPVYFEPGLYGDEGAVC